jgi:hypothetical protein
MLAPDAGSDGHECAKSSSTLHHHFANLQIRQTVLKCKLLNFPRQPNFTNKLLVIPYLHGK